jgi:hypothetical protein
MGIHEFKTRVTTSKVPILVMEPESSRGTVLLYHGLGAAKEVQRKEMVWLAEAGFTAVCVDAPHHGERDDGLLEAIGQMSDAEAHPRVMNIVREAIAEIPVLVDHCMSEYSDNVAIAGISLGGFVAYGAVPVEPRLKAAVPILGSPDWAPKNGEPSSEMRQLLEQAPVHFPDRFPPCAVFGANAGKDIFVPPAASRAFFQTLDKMYQDFPDRLKYVEYPESEHFMREQDWNDLWRDVIDWFGRFLGPEATEGSR